MMRKTKLLKTFFIAIVISATLTGCDYSGMTEWFTGVDTESNLNTFSGKGTIRTYHNDKLISDITFVETKGIGRDYYYEASGEVDLEYYLRNNIGLAHNSWISNNKVSVDKLYIVNDKETIIALPYKNYYSFTEGSNINYHPDKFMTGINNVLESGGLKEYAMKEINALADKYDLTMEDNVTLQGRKTQHIIGTSKVQGDNSTCEIWVDQSTWMIMKKRTECDGWTNEYEYESFKCNPKIKKEFDIEIPSDAIVNMLSEDTSSTNMRINIEQGTSLLEVPIYALKDEEILSTEYIEDTINNMSMVKVTYDLLYNETLVIENHKLRPEEKKIYIATQELMPVSGQMGVYSRYNNIQILEFHDDETCCYIYTPGGAMSKEKFQHYVDKLVKMGTGSEAMGTGSE